MVIDEDQRPASEHIRQYNSPSCSEAATIIFRADGGIVGRRDILLKRRGTVNCNGNEVLDTIQIAHRSYDSLTFKLLLTFDEYGWHIQMTSSAPKTSQAASSSARRSGRRFRQNISTMFYCYRLYTRPEQFSTFHRCCRLFQQYLVDQFCKVECETLSFLRQIQQKLRVADYTSLCEQLEDLESIENDAEVVRLGRLFILLLKHLGGDRYMRHNMHDFIALSNRFGPQIYF